MTKVRRDILLMVLSSFPMTMSRVCDNNTIIQAVVKVASQVKQGSSGDRDVKGDEEFGTF